MDTLASAPTRAPGTSQAITAPSPKLNSAETGTLRARFVLVEDVDHLMRTGEPRQVLAVRWVY